ncbi:MAG: hypothetical protein SGPRY_003110, partial [Prymnesium sp.]
RGRLALTDLPLHHSDVASADARLQARRSSRPSEGLGASLTSVFAGEYAAAALCKLLADVLKYIPPLLLSLLLSGLKGGSDQSDTASTLYLYCVALSLPAVAMIQAQAPALAPPRKREATRFLRWRRTPPLPAHATTKPADDGKDFPCQAIMVNQYFWRILRLGVLVRGTAAAAIYRRTLQFRLREGADGGQLANIISSDCGRLNTVCGSLCTLWSSPLQLLIALSMLWRALGPPVLAGGAVILLLWPLQLAISRGLAAQRNRRASTATLLLSLPAYLLSTDARLKVCEAALVAAKALKLQGWEELYEGETAAARKREMWALRREAALKAANLLLVTMAPTLVSLCSFTALALSGVALEPSTVFSSLALFNSLRAPLSALPDLFSALAHARVALRRIEATLTHHSCATPYIDPNSAGVGEKGCGQELSEGEGEEEKSGRGGGEGVKRGEAGEGDVLIVMLDATFCWGLRPSTTTLSPKLGAAMGKEMGEGKEQNEVAMDLKVPKGGEDKWGEEEEPEGGGSPWLLRSLNLRLGGGQLVAVVGGMGEGKSSVLKAMMGEMLRLAGEMRMPGGRVGYCGQQVWLARATIRENILFGLPLERRRYASVLSAVGLTSDVASWPLGDMTEAGERGVALSGGQQARVALARVLYSRPPVILLDDPLAALDPPLASHVWAHAIRAEASRGAAVVVACGSPQQAMKADFIYVIQKGEFVQASAAVAYHCFETAKSAFTRDAVLAVTASAVSKPLLAWRFRSHF